MKYFKLITTFILIGLLNTSCVRDANHGDANSDSNKVLGEGQSFFVSEAGLQYTVKNLSYDSTWGVPKSKQFTFKFCLVSKVTRNPLPAGLTFEIVKENGSRDRDQTDKYGCIDWIEPLIYNYFADSKYMKTRRVIKSVNDIHSGQLSYPFAVNPWIDEKRDSSQEVVIDLVKSPGAIPKNHLIDTFSGEGRVQLFSDEGKGAQLLLENKPVVYFNSEYNNPKSKQIKGSIEFKPFVHIYDLNGEKVRHYFKKGQFDLRIQIVVDHLKEKENARINLIPGVSKDIDAKLNDLLMVNETFTFKLSEEVSLGNVKVAIKVTPKGGSFIKAIARPFQASYLHGKYWFLFRGSVKYQDQGTLLNDGTNGFDFDTYINESWSIEKSRKEGTSRQLQPIKFSEIYPRFLKIASGETAMKRTVNFRLQTRVIDGVEEYKIGNQKFKIYTRPTNDPDTRTIPEYNKETGVLDATYENVTIVKTNPQGVLKWTDSVAHEYYIPEKYYFREYVIVHLDSGNVQLKQVAINPWDDKWTFGHDLNGSDRDQIIAENEKERKKLRFMIDAFRYQTIRFRYEVDPFMNLDVKKAVVMALDPLVQKESITEGRSFRPLRDGIYLVKVALVRHFIDPFKANVRLHRTNEGEFKISAVGETKTDDGIGVKKQEIVEDSAKGIYTTVVKKLLRVQAGRITTPLEFSMRDLRMMSIRTNIMVQIDPIDEDKLMNYNILDEKTDLLVSEYKHYNSLSKDEKKIFEKNLRKQVEEQKASFESFVSHNKSQLDDQRQYVNQLYSQRDKNIDDVIADTANLNATEIVEKRIGLYNQELTEFNSYISNVRSSYDKLEALLLSKRLEEQPSYYDEVLKDDINLDYLDGQLNGIKVKDQKNLNSLMALAPHPRAKNGIDGYRIKPIDAIDNGTYSSSNDSIYSIKKYPEVFFNKKLKINNREDLLSYKLPEKYTKRARNSKKEKLIYSPSMYDYIAVMNQYFQDKNMGMFVSKEDIDSMRLNDYTARPAAPVVDLNHLIYEYSEDADKALQSRTFIGPCTLVADDNMSEMRPTDTIDEKYCDRVDCGEQLTEKLNKADNAEFENSEYHGSLAPFADMTVDQIIVLHKRLEKHYVKEMTALSQVGRFLEMNNLDFSSLNEKSVAKKFVEGCDYDKKNHSCFAPISSSKTNDIDSLFVGTPSFEDRKLFYVRSNLSASAGVKRKLLYDVEDSQPFVMFKENYRESDDGSVDKYLEKFLLGIGLTQDFDVIPRQDVFDSANGIGYTPGHSALDKHQKAANAYQAHFLKIKNDPSSMDIDKKAVQLWIEKGSSAVTVAQIPTLCHKMANSVVEDYSSKFSKFKGTSVPEKSLAKFQNNIFKRCLKTNVYYPEVDKLNLSGLSLHRQLLVKETGKFEHKAGKNMNINVGNDFSVSGFNSLSRDSSKSFNLVQVAGGLGLGLAVWPHMKVGGLIAGALLGGLASPFGDTDSTSVSMGYQRSKGSSVSAGTYLVVQRAEVEIELLQYERCLVVRLNSEAYKKDRKTLGLKKKYYHTGLIGSAFSKGHFICEGKNTNKTKNPTKVREDYYYVTQHFTAGDILDKGSLLNHVWLLSIRGRQDFNRFKKIIDARQVDKDGKEVNIESANYPLEVLERSYSKLAPSFPGMYSVRE